MMNNSVMPSEKSSLISFNARVAMNGFAGKNVGMQKRDYASNAHLTSVWKWRLPRHRALWRRFGLMPQWLRRTKNLAPNTGVKGSPLPAPIVKNHSPAMPNSVPNVAMTLNKKRIAPNVAQKYPPAQNFVPNVDKSCKSNNTFHFLRPGMPITPAQVFYG